MAQLCCELFIDLAFDVLNVTQIRMGGRGFGDLGGKEIGEGGSEGRRGEGNFKVGSVLDGEGMEREIVQSTMASSCVAQSTAARLGIES